MGVIDFTVIEQETTLTFKNKVPQIISFDNKEEYKMSELSELMEKAGLFGLGALAITEEKANKITKDLIKKGKMKKPEAKKFAKEVLENSKKQQMELQKRIEKQTKKTIALLGIPSKTDMAKLEKRIKALEKKLNSLRA